MSEITAETVRRYSRETDEGQDGIVPLERGCLMCVRIRTGPIFSKTKVYKSFVEQCSSDLYR